MLVAHCQWVVLDFRPSTDGRRKSNSMRPQVYRVDSLVALLQKLKIATMNEMKGALGTRADMTVFRKLREIEYCSSYSHRGQYYALTAVAEFDERGLWTCRRVHFSRYGSLVDTAESFVSSAARGYRASELSAELRLETKATLLRLTRLGRVVREAVAGRYVYCSPDPEKRRQQLLARRLPPAHHPVALLWGPAAESSEETRAAIILFFSTLDEKQRRLYAGLESLRLGRGGDRRIADLTGMDVHTIAKGRRELLSGDLGPDRVRRPGGGRRPVEKKDAP